MQSFLAGKHVSPALSVFFVICLSITDKSSCKTIFLAQKSSASEGFREQAEKRATASQEDGRLNRKG